jgi:ribonucleotide reductase alpha subunit
LCFGCNPGKMSTISMQVIKRDGSKEDVSFDKVLNRIKKSAAGLEVNPTLIAQRTLMRIYDGVKTTELDELAAQLSISLVTTHADYGGLASQIAISNHQKNTSGSFVEVIEELSHQVHTTTGKPMQYISDELRAVVAAFGPVIDAKIDYSRDYLLDYFGFKTLEKQKYLMRTAYDKVVERPQHLWMRVALCLWGAEALATGNLDKAFETYDLLSQKYFIHATPTNFNAGSPRQQLSSCFVAGTLVHTMNGVKNIEEVELGDEVVTHTGSVKKVTQLHKNLLNGRMIYDIKIAGTPTISVTENHRLMSLSDEQEKWGKKPSWNPVGYLRSGDWINIPKKISGEEFILDVKDILDHITSDGNNINYSYTYDDTRVYPVSNYVRKLTYGDVEFNKKGGSFNRYWKFDTEMMELMGIWYGDGCVYHEKNSARILKPRGINIVSHNTNTKLIEFVEKTIKDKIRPDHISIHRDNHNMVSIAICNQFIACIFKSIFKCGFDGKRLPSFFNKLGFDEIQAFLSGLVSSDGCVSREGAVTIQLTNPPLCQDIFHLARSVGIPMTMTMMHKPGAKAIGRMTVPMGIIADRVKKCYADERLAERGEVNIWNQVRFIDGGVYMRLTSKTPSEEKPEYVYTLGVEDDHSYSVGGIIAENCYLLSMDSDSITGIYKTLGDCAQISKYAGGIGLHIHNIRAKGSHIAGNGGTSTGIVPMLRNFNATARYVDQGSKRNGSFAIYLEPWHADVEDFLRLKLNTGSEEERARDLFYALWIPDLFMERVESGGTWTLFCPSEAPGLADVWGDEFKALYEKYEAEGKGKKTIEAQKLWFKILDSQIETGTPYLLYKDAANAKSNQQNLGTIKSSNLCVAPETMILTDQGQYPISSLHGKTVNVWNGDKWSETTVMKTGSNQKLIKINLSNGSSLECTPYHKFILQSSENIINAPRKDAKDLQVGDILINWYSFNNIKNENVTVVSVEDEGRIDDTYCFNEPLNHAGVFNGVLTGNCTEIIEYSDKDETAVCNLASIALPTYVDQKRKKFNFDKMREVVKVATKNLNRVIDINFYPTPETKRSNTRHRPVGLGVQGLADVFAMLRMSWESEAAAELNQRIFEHLYYAALEASNEIAVTEGPYETFAGSPASKGLLQYDLWKMKPLTEEDGTLDWAKLKEHIVTKGLRNSLLVAPMPTASTSQILGFNECIEPVTSNIYTRRTLSGEYIIVNRYLMKELQAIGLWNETMKQNIIARNGSVLGIEDIPKSIQERYKTSWEIKQKTLIDMAAARGAFVCQSQSLNLFVADPTYAKLTSMHFYAWKKGLKTGIYYLRTKAPVMAQKFTIDPELQKMAEQSELERQKKEYEAPEGCLMCGS